jgi:hypothetical protein
LNTSTGSTKGRRLLYAWHATAAVNLEFHAEPDGAPKGYAETYEKRTGVEHASGTLMAPFAGIHGWYWENPTDHEVTVTLTSAGFYNLAHEFPEGYADRHQDVQVIAWYVVYASPSTSPRMRKVR